ncbi:outer membrane beta-barrel protein [Flaviaesturariibacter terrae]
MKKRVLLIPLFLAASSGYAQWTKGRYVAGAGGSFNQTDNAGASSGNTGSSHYHGGSMGLSVGKLLRDNLAAGVEISYGWSKGSTDTDRDRGSNIGGGFFLKRYLPIAGRFSFDVAGGLQYNHGAGDSWVNDVKFSSWRSNNVGIAVSPGLNFRMSRHLFLSGRLAQLFRLNYSASRYHDFGPIGGTSRSRDFTAVIGAGGAIPFQFGLTALF